MSYCDYSVLCKNFPEKFYDLVKINGYIGNNHSLSELEDHLYEFANFPSTLNYVIRDDIHNQIVCIYDMDNLRYYRIEIIFLKDNYVRFVVHTSYDKADCDVTMKFNTKGFESLFNFPVDEVFQTAEESTSEPEHPEEDAEEQENPEQTPNAIEMPLCVFQLMQNKVYDYVVENDIIDKYGDKEIPCGVMVKIIDYSPQSKFECHVYDVLGEEAEERRVKIEPLTPLEEAVFEEIENCYERYNEYSELAKVAEYGAEYNGESAEEIVRYGHLANEQIFNSDYLKELISKAGLQETYQAWLIERKKQKALTVL